MAPILNCIHGAFNRGLNYFSTFHPPKFPEVPQSNARLPWSVMKPHLRSLIQKRAAFHQQRVDKAVIEQRIYDKITSRFRPLVAD